MVGGYRELVQAAKLVSGDPDWYPHKRVHSTVLKLYAPLEIDGVNRAGLELRGNAVQEVPEDAVTFQLMVSQPGRKPVMLSRLEWDTNAQHTNRMLGAPHLRGLQIQGTHFHEFEANAELGEEFLTSPENLPVARPVDGLASYEDALAFLAKQMNITNAESIPPPPWPNRFRLKP
jgi:hypothetical protein